MGRRINGRFDSFKAAVRRFVHRVLIITLAGLALYSAAWIGSTFFPYTVYATNEVKVPVDPAYPVLDRIAKCESGSQHWSKSGQVIFNANTNGTVDVGKYQINTVWFAQATELGLDLTKEADNEKMAKWIYLNHGTEPWYSSEACWSK